MKFLSNTVLYGSSLVEALTDKYYLHCDTMAEVNRALQADGITLSFVPPTQCGDRISGDYVIVEISKEEDYTEHELYLCEIPPHLKEKFLDYMNRELGEEPEL